MNGNDPLKWVSLATDFFDDEAAKLVSKLPEGDWILLLWLRLLCLAGKSNDNGRLSFRMGARPYNMQMLAALFDHSESVVKMAIEALLECGAVVEEDGALRIADWERKQRIEGIEHLNRVAELNRIRQQQHRDRVKKRAALPALTTSAGTSLAKDSSGPTLPADVVPVLQDWPENPIISIEDIRQNMGKAIEAEN